MARELDKSTLDAAAEHYAGELLRPDVFSKTDPNIIVWGRGWVMNNLVNAQFKDEHEYLLQAMHGFFGSTTKKLFEGLASDRFSAREDSVLEKLLADKLAIDPDGRHIPGKIGSTKVGGHHMGVTLVTVEAPDSIARRKRLGIMDKSRLGPDDMRQKLIRVTWPIYAGEDIERKAESGVYDLYPIGGGALNTRISNESALLGANALVDNLDEGSAGATIQGRTGSQPTDPDTAVSGTNLFTLTCSTTAFTAATDAAPGALKTASSITDDTSADATGTLGYCRASSSNAANTPLDDHIDGEAGTSGADWNLIP